MSDSNNNPNQGNASNQVQQNSNSSLAGNPYGAASSGLNYGNGYSGYDRPSGYGSYMDNSYGSSYNSSYGGSSGYGGYGGYNSSYGGYGYNRGYGGSGYSNQYSNHYSKPLPQNGQNEQQPPQNFRHDVWGFLNGFHAMLNVLYAATGIVHFGKIFVKMSLKLIKLICGKSLGLVFKLTGFKFIKDILMSFSNSGNWSSEFNLNEQPFENAWGNDSGRVNANSTIFSKIMLVLRVCSLLGTMFALFLRSKARNQHPPVDAEVVGPEAFPNEAPQIPQNSVDLEKIKNFYDEIKLIEEEQVMNQNSMPSVSNVPKEQDQEAETFVQVFEDAQAALEELVPESEPIQVISESNQEDSSKVDEPTALLENSEPVTKEDIKLDTNIESQEEKPVIPIFEKIETSWPAESVSEKYNETAKFDIAPTPDTVSTNVSSTSKDTIVSEDFWKNEVTFKAIENIQKEEKTKPEEIKKKEFELPSVLLNLRSNSTTSSNKPWLMKKKKTVEVPVAAPQQVENNPAETLEKINETPNSLETKVENVSEIAPVLEVPEAKLEICAENLEGTNV